MNKTLHKHWLGRITPLFPAGTKFTSFDNLDDFKAKAYWKLNNDPNRPNKSSRIVIVEITEKAIEDYQSKSATRQEEDDTKITAQIEEFLSEFDPNHDSFPGEPTPEVKLLISGAVLNS